MNRRILGVMAIGIVLVAAGVLAYLFTPATGTLVVQVRDTPGGLSRLLVTFSQVLVHPADAANESNWRTVNLSSRTVDFAALGNLTQVLGLDRLPAGRYTQIRIVVSGASGTTSGGIGVTLVVPDGVLKTDQPFDLRPGGVTTITFDFDLAASVQQAGSSWIFTPVVGSVVVS